jgi:putative phosphoesterase
VLIGVVSDTHNNLKNVRRMVEIFNLRGVDHVIHTGDITQAKVLQEFRHLQADLTGVYGNNDQGELTPLQEASDLLGFNFCQPPLYLNWADRRIMVVHDPVDAGPTTNAGSDLLLHGHTHRRTIEIEQQTLIFNPGESAGLMPGHNAVGLLDLVDMQPEIIRF